jgi:fucose permease
MTTTKGELLDILKSVRIAPFLLIAACYVTWGFTNDIIGVTVSAFEHIFNLNALEGTYVNIVKSR